jgi:hypothetical protein
MVLEKFKLDVKIGSKNTLAYLAIVSIIERNVVDNGDVSTNK